MVTGASSGIGAATARALGARGWKVVLIARRTEELAKVATQIEAVGGTSIIEPLDAADVDAVGAMARRVTQHHGVPGLLVHSAGAGAWRWPEDTPPYEMERMLDAPYRAAYLVTHAFLDAMLERRAGLIVHVGSPAAIAPWPGATGYTVSRWALRGLHEALRQDLAKTGLMSCHVVVAEVSSEYFDNNDGARDRRPWLGRLVKTSTPAEAAEVILRTIDRPRPQVAEPAMLRWLVRLHRLAPGFVAWLLRATGAKRDRS